MAKKQNQQLEENQRQSRKEVLLKRKEQEQKRNIYIAGGLIIGLLAILFLIGIIIEFVISPGRSIATVADEDITLSEWEERVVFERAQRIVLLENQLESFGDVSLIQQFYGQVITELIQPEIFGQTVKNQMVDDIAIRQAAEARGITVSEAEVDAWIEESFGYFGGEAPTPFPTATETIMPTPSLTPIPTAVITELLPTNTPAPTFTPAPTQPPPPTATPKSAEAYDEEYSTFLADFTEYGVTEAQYREFVRAQLYRDKLADALAEEQALPTEAEHASFLFLAIENEEEANELLAQVEAEGFLQVWNEVRSGVTEAGDGEEASTTFASEILWRDQDNIEQTFGSEVAETAFDLDLEEPSGALIQVVDAETNRYFIIYVTGKELRELSQNAIDQTKFELVQALVDDFLSTNLTFTDFEQGRAPSRPSLDPAFYTVQATEPAPLELPEVPADN